MKIKSKLIAGGLMTVVACALVGSITGTFAWYQYSTSATASLHGVTVGASRGLEFRFKTGQDTYTEWASGNLNWATIKTYVAANKNNADSVELLPVSNGDNNGEQALNAKWYGNPNETSSLPEITDGNGYLQFEVYARLKEKTGSGNSDYVLPDAKLFVTDIQGVIRKETSANVYQENTELEKALRMHVSFAGYEASGNETAIEDTNFVVNPVHANGAASETVTLSASLSKPSYDWDGSPAASPVVYKLPTRGAGNEDTIGTLTTLTHASVMPNATYTSGKYGTIKADTAGTGLGLKITITLWLEGFTKLDYDSDSTTTNDTSEWWNFNANLDQDVFAGLEFTAVKDAA